MEEFILNSIGPSWMHEMMEYQRKRDYLMAKDNRDILREQVMRSLADFYRMNRRDLYQTMRKVMQKSEEACVDIPEIWPHIRRLLDELVILLVTSKHSQREFDDRLRQVLRYLMVLYDHVVPPIDECRTRYAHRLFAEPRPPRPSNFRVNGIKS